MNPINLCFQRASRDARSKRAALFRNLFVVDTATRILDLGSENGSNIRSVLEGTEASPENIYIADIDETLVREGAKLYGYIPVPINETQKLPFPDQFFDIVYCSSVIEHVTVPKEDVWRVYSGSQFRACAQRNQRRFAEEVKRVGKNYFVQCPYKHFPIESHSWLPFVAWLPRWLLISLLRVTNTFWVKRTNPDWYLLNQRELMALFDNAKCIREKSFGFTKSIMAVYNDPAISAK